MQTQSDPVGIGRLLDRRQVGERTGFGLTKVSEWIRSGALPHVRIDGSVRVAEADLAAFIEARRVAEQPTVDPNPYGRATRSSTRTATTKVPA